MKKASSRQGKPIAFHKLHGAGNDIIVVESRNLPQTGKSALLRRMAHRQTGVGCDQFVEVLSFMPLTVQIWNGDGSKAEMCANGLRVLLVLAAKEGWVSAKAKEVPVLVSGKAYLGLKVSGGYEVCLGEPKILGANTLKLGDASIPYFEVNVGNPHAVVLLGKKKGQWPAPVDFDFRLTGAQIENHPDFPHKTNVEFVRSWGASGQSAKAIVDTWERGAGATLSCGSGAVAVAAVLRELKGCSKVEIRMTDFLLKVRFEGRKAFLSGPVAPVAEGFYFP